MPSRTTFYVPVKLCVKQYFEKEYGADPILVVSNNLLGQLVMLCTEKLPYRVTQRRPANRAELLALRMPKRLQSRTMSDTQREELTRLLEKIFHDDVYKFIRSQAAVTGSEWAALRCFSSVYELDSESFDIDKVYKLWRDKKRGVVNDNRQAVADWYASNRILSDDHTQHNHATVSTN